MSRDLIRSLADRLVAATVVLVDAEIVPRLVQSIGLAYLPDDGEVAAGRIREFHPGWVPPPLRFTASWLAEPRSHMVEFAAHAARDVAQEYRATLDDRMGDR